jgi:phospholipase/carboxylesterase
LSPGAGLLDVRGKVLENGMPRFFRRFAKGVFDVDDLNGRTSERAEFIGGGAEHYAFQEATGRCGRLFQRSQYLLPG